MCVQSKIIFKVFVYERQQQRRRRRGYDNSSQNIYIPAN